jgi:hypothetical protein
LGEGLLETSSYSEITQLFWATIAHFPTKTLTILRQGVSPNTKDYRSFTPLAYAAALSYSEIARVLLNNSNDICWNCGTATGGVAKLKLFLDASEAPIQPCFP